MWGVWWGWGSPENTRDAKVNAGSCSMARAATVTGSFGSASPAARATSQIKSVSRARGTGAAAATWSRMVFARTPARRWVRSAGLTALCCLACSVMASISPFIAACSVLNVMGRFSETPASENTGEPSR